MKIPRMLYAAILSLIVGLPMLGGQAHAASVSFFLDQSNENVFLPDGVNYLQVTIADGVLGDIDFRVDILAPLTDMAGNNFGIQAFGFNGPDGLTASNVLSSSLPSGWTARGNRNLDGFGRFEVAVSGTGNNRQSPLMFSIDIGGDSLSDYAALSHRNAGEGNVFFAAHVAGLLDQDPDGAFFGGSTLVPIPPAVWLFGSGLVALLTFARRRHSARE